MSTRAHVVVKNEIKRHYLYRHCDGYPSELGETLKRCLSEFKPDIYTVSNVSSKIAEDCYVEDENIGIHGDEEYIYEINVCDTFLNMKCFKIPYTDDPGSYKSGEPIIDIKIFNK